MGIWLTGSGLQVVELDCSPRMIDADSPGHRSGRPGDGLARALPFHAVSMDAALRESLRVLKPDGPFCYLEILRPWAPLRTFDYAYCRNP